MTRSNPKSPISPLPTPIPALTRLHPYIPGLPLTELARRYSLDPTTVTSLASNENPYGMSPRTRTTIRTAITSGHRYPDQHDLTQALADHHHLTPAHITLGNGSNELIDLIARAHLDTGLTAISSQYAFAMYEIAVTATGATNIIVPAHRYSHDLTAIQSAILPTTRVIWLTNPNNPTGTFVPYPQVKSFIETIPTHILIVLDEAYYEYLPPELKPDTTRWLADHPNLILLRTFSKIHGLAGLRLGYALAHPTITETLNRLRAPFNVSSISLAAGVAALADQAYLDLAYRRNSSGLGQLITGLDQLGLAVIPALKSPDGIPDIASVTNFVTVHFPSHAATSQRPLISAASVHEALLRHGVITRPLANYGLPDHLRITVGRPAEIKRLLAALDDILSA